MRGCAGAGSTQARTLTCMSPPPLALHPCLDLCAFRDLSNSDRAPVFVFVLCTCLDQAGARFEPGFARGLPATSQALNQWNLSRLDECKVWVWVWLEASSFLQTEGLGWTVHGVEAPRPWRGWLGLEASGGPERVRVFGRLRAHSCLWDWERRRKLPLLPPCSTAPGSLSLGFRV